MRIIRSSIIGLAFTSAIIGSQENLTAQGRLDVVTVGIYGDTIFAAEAENIKKRMKQIRATAKREKLRRGSPRWLELKQKQSDLQKKLDDLSNVPVTTIHFFGVATGWDKTDEVLLHLRNNRADIGRQICVWQDERAGASFGDERWIVSNDCAADVGGTVYRQQKQRNVAGTYEASWGPIICRLQVTNVVLCDYGGTSNWTLRLQFSPDGQKLVGQWNHNDGTAPGPVEFDLDRNGDIQSGRYGYAPGNQLTHEWPGTYRKTSP